MGKITVKEKKRQCVITNRLDKSESVNRQAVKNISDHFAGFFLPIRLEEKKKGTVIWCAVQGLVTLERFMQSPVSRDVFLGIVENVIQMLRACEKHAMSEANLELNPKLIFLEAYSKRVFCIYWPLANAQNLSPVPAFFQNLSQYAGLAGGDRAFQQAYGNFFRGSQPFSLDRFEEFIRRIRGGNHLSASSSQGKGEDLTRKSVSGRSIAYDPYEGAAAAAAGGGSAGGTYGWNHTSSRDDMSQQQNGTWQSDTQQRQSAGRGTELLQQYSTPRQYQGGTTNLKWAGEAPGQSGQEMAASSPTENFTPHLVRQKTGEKIPIIKSTFRIGAERDTCDYCISDNTAVSRKHADIITRDGHFYVRDNGSLNKTYVDMRVVAPEREAEIFSGSRLRFANEEYTFYG